MKRTLLFGILGLMLALTGCRSDDAESSIQKNEADATASETNSVVSTESEFSAIPETASQIPETTVPYSELTVTGEQTTISNADVPTVETVSSLPASQSKTEEKSIPDTTVSQLETSSEEEDNDDFGELFS